MLDLKDNHNISSTRVRGDASLVECHRTGQAKRVYNLDGLRFVAALAVVFFHFAYRGAVANQMPTLALDNWLVEISKYGYLGVSIFFMISGYVIAFSAKGRSPIAFAIARFTRLYPSYIAAMTITFAVTFWFGEPYIASTYRQYLANLSMVAPAFGQPFMDGAYWSIVLEIVFYFWVFLLLAIGIFHRYQLALIAVWLIVAFVTEFAWGPSPLRSVLLTEFAGFFAAGILIYRISEGMKEPVVWILLALALTHSVATTIFGLDWLEQSYADDFSPWAAASIIVAGYALFFAAVFSNARILPPSLLIWSGALTYPLYLLHQHIGYVAFWRLQGASNDVAQLALVISALIAAAGLLWFLVERPLIPFLRRLLTNLIAKRFYSQVTVNGARQ